MLEQNDTILSKNILSANFSLDKTFNTLILNAAIDYAISTKRFDGRHMLNILGLSGVTYLSGVDLFTLGYEMT